MNIRRIKPIIHDDGTNTLLVYYEDGSVERVENDNIEDFLRSHSGLPETATDAEVVAAYDDVKDTPATTEEEIEEAENEFAAAEALTGDDDDEDLEEDDPEEKKKYGAGALVGVGLGAAALGGLAGAGATYAMMNNQQPATRNQIDLDNAYGNDTDNDNDQTAQNDQNQTGNQAADDQNKPAGTTADEDQKTDEDQTTATVTDTEFTRLMAGMDETDVRRVASEDAMRLVTTFHNQTHKEGNFRLEEDGETYLDLTFEEALVLTTFANYSEPADMYEIFGTYNITSEEAQDILESARSKMITYYMNSVEPSGLAEIFHSEEDRAFFTQFENDVLTFNKEHTTEASDQVIRDVYYNYVLDDATVDNVGPLARLLAFDTVYGGLNLVESADVEHTQFLVFHGMGPEAETRYLVENVYHLNYDELTDEEKATYRTNIIESTTQLVDLFPNGEVMHEDNSTQEQRDANWSITDLVDRMGLCNVVNNTITELMRGLDSMEAAHVSTASNQITNINLTLVSQLYNSGEHELATRVAGQVNEKLSPELLEELSHVKGVQGIVANYETMMSTINNDNRPGMDQIIAAARGQLETLENYSGYTSTNRDIATLVNNRRHTNFRLGLDEATTGPVVPGPDTGAEVIDEHEETTTEEITEEDLTPEEQEEVEEQQEVIEAQLTLENASAQGHIGANNYANSGSYHFGRSVTDPANGATYDLDGMSFANGLAYGHAFGGLSVSTGDSQIQAAAEQAAENYANSFSAADREAIARGLGTSWENAKQQIKNAYKSGYIAQMQSEIAASISVGEEMRATSEAMIQEIEELNQQEDEQQQEQQPEDEQDLDEGEEELDDTQGDEELDQTDPDRVEEGEEPVIETPADEDTHEEDPSAEEELDQTDSDRVEEGEEPVITTPPDAEITDPVIPVVTESTDDEIDQADPDHVEEGEVEVPFVAPAEEPIIDATQTTTPMELPDTSTTETDAEAEAAAEAARAEAAERAAAEEEARIQAEREAAERAAAEQAAREAAEREAAEQAAREAAERAAAEQQQTQPAPAPAPTVEEGEEPVVEEEVEAAYQKSL